MSLEAPDDRLLSAEFARSARHVAGVAATPYQTGKYLDFHRQRPVGPCDEFDGVLLRLSRAGGLGLALADAYSGTLYRRSVVRKKLVLATAILETSPPSFAVLDAPDPGGPLALVRLGLRLVEAGVALVAAAILLAPAHLWFAVRARRAT